MSRMRAILHGPLPWRTPHLPAIVALLGTGILLLIWGLAPPSGRSAANSPSSSIHDWGAPAPPVAHPVSTITWQPTSTFNEPIYDNIYPAIHPTDPLRALVGGPGPLRYTTDGGVTWQSANGLNGLPGGVPVWVPGGNGQTAWQVSLSQGTAQPQANLTPGPTGNSLNFARSTDGGANWSPPMTLTIPGIAENQPYLWADDNQTSPYYGRMYLTLTMLDSGRTGSFDTVGVLRSTDQGVSWSAPVGLVNPNEFMQGTNYNAFASAAIQPSGAVVVAWHRGTCCGAITNVPNKIMWSRSTDGGVTFPISGTMASVPVSQSLQYNSFGPANFRWTPAPNIAADPVDGTLYAAWVAFRSADTPTSAAVYLSRSTNNGTSWSTPVVAGNGPYQYWYLPWLQVSLDHVVHLTFQGALLTDLAAHFYTQSTDGGATWSTPFQLSGAGYSYFGQGDYQATSVGGYNGSQGTILTSWQLMIGSGVRMGSFPLGGGTPTATASPTQTCTPAGTPGPWSVGVAYPLGLNDIAVASDGATLYGFGGRMPNGDRTVAYKYAGTGSWTPIASLPVAMSGAGAEYGHNGKIYVIYGPIPYVYDIATDSWSSGAPGPQSYTYFTGHAYWNGKVYLIGGLQNGSPATSVYSYDIATGSWSTLAPLPQAEYSIASAAIDGKIYVANGHVGGGGVTNQLYIYDIATDTWSQGASSPLASSSPAGTAIDGKLYMIGGDPQGTGWGYTSNTYLYDPAGDSWSQGPGLNVARSRASAATIYTPDGQTAIVVGGSGSIPWLNSVEASTAPNVPCATATVTHSPSSPTRTVTPTATATCATAGTPGPWAVRANYPQMLTDVAVASDGTTVYAFGGRNGSGRHTQTYKYDYATDSWTALASFPYDAIAEAEAEYGHNGKIYVIWDNGTYIYDIAANSWSLGAPTPQGVLSFGHVYWDGKIYVIGGYINNALNAVYAYDIATDSWSTLAPLPQAEGLVASAAINGRIYVANGQTAGGATNNLYIYDIATNTWTQGASSPLASAAPGSTAIGGKLYMIGGNIASAGTSNTYLYDPATNSWSQGPSLNVARGGGNAAIVSTQGGQTTIVVGGANGVNWLNSVEASTAPNVPCSTATRTLTPTVTVTATATPTCAPGVAWDIRPERYQGILDGVAAISANDVWAVGTDQSQHWDGSQWSIVPSPSGLYAVSAVSSNDVWAVGGTVAAHWNGSQWSIVPLPPNADPLYGVAAISSNDVWAVGTGQALHWNGTNWNFVPGSNGPLYAVTAISANDVWAVGGGPSQALIEHWNGSTWSVVPNPGSSTLRGVAGVSANDVWAVGGRLTLHWDGSQWSVVPSPVNYTLFAVAAISSSNVWAVGYCTTGCGEVYHVGSLHWDGSTWNQVTVHDRNQGPWSILYGVAAVSSSEVWAVGYDTSGSGSYTLIEHYPAPPCGVTTTPTPTPPLRLAPELPLPLLPLAPQVVCGANWPPIQSP